MSGWDHEHGEPERTAVRSFETMAPHEGAGARQAAGPFAGGHLAGDDPAGTDGGGSSGRGRLFILTLLGAVVVGAGVFAALFLLNRDAGVQAEEAAYLTMETDRPDGSSGDTGAADADDVDAAGDDEASALPDPTPTPVPTAAPTPTPAPTPTVTPAPLIDCIGDVPCCVTGPYLPITEDTVGIAFDALVDPAEPFGVRYLENGPVGGFEFNDEDWFDFERLGETGLDRFLVAPRSSLSGIGCDFGAAGTIPDAGGESTAPAPGLDGALPLLIVDGIGQLKFGTSTVAASLEAFEPFLGPASVSAIGECPSGADEAIAWDGLQLVFRDDRLEGWFYDGRFETDPRMITASGVEIGMTEAEMRLVYVGATVEETTIGREFSFTVPSGTMSGLISEGQVASLWAGGVCIFR